MADKQTVEALIRKWATALYLKYEPEDLPKSMGVVTPSIDLENAITEMSAQLNQLLIKERLAEQNKTSLKTYEDGHKAVVVRVTEGQEIEQSIYIAHLENQLGEKS